SAATAAKAWSSSGSEYPDRDGIPSSCMILLRINQAQGTGLSTATVVAISSRAGPIETCPAQRIEGLLSRSVTGLLDNDHVPCRNRELLPVSGLCAGQQIGSRPVLVRHFHWIR